MKHTVRLGALLALAFAASDATAQRPVAAPRARTTAIVLDSAQIRAGLARPDVAAELRRVSGIRLDSATLRRHQIRPAHVADADSDDGPLRRAPNPAASMTARLDSSAVRAVLAGQGVSVAQTEIAPGRMQIRTGPRLDVAAFTAELHQALRDNVVGYTMQLRRNGQTISTLQWNWSRRPGDGNLGWNPERRMHVASVSKLITAIALVRLLGEKNISVDAPIAPYLPTHWQRGPNVGQITFRHLLTHRSGIEVPGSSTDYWTMRSEIAAGVAAGAIGQSQYENTNFGLMRILIPVINGDVPANLFAQAPPSPTPTIVDQIWDEITIGAYQTYVRQRVFAPAGVAGNVGMVSAPTGALAYSFTQQGPGWSSGDLRSVGGGAGWVMSAGEVLAVMHEFRRGGGIVSPEVARLALDSGFGVDVVQDTPAGRLYNKNGRWQNNGRAEQSLAYFLPENMELVVFANSPVGPQDVFFRTLVTTIYQNNVK